MFLLIFKLNQGIERSFGFSFHQSLFYDESELWFVSLL